MSYGFGPGLAIEYIIFRTIIDEEDAFDISAIIPKTADYLLKRISSLHVDQVVWHAARHGWTRVVQVLAEERATVKSQSNHWLLEHIVWSIAAYNGQEETLVSATAWDPVLCRAASLQVGSR